MRLRLVVQKNEFGPILEETEQFHGGIKMMVWGYITPEGPAHIAELLLSIDSKDYVDILDEFLNYREFADRSLHYLQISTSILTTPIQHQLFLG